MKNYTCTIKYDTNLYDYDMTVSYRTKVIYFYDKIFVEII